MAASKSDCDCSEAEEDKSISLSKLLINGSLNNKFLNLSRNNRLCCPQCTDEAILREANDILFYSRSGLIQHYRIKHPNEPFDEQDLDVAQYLTRIIVGKQTFENISYLSQLRESSNLFGKTYVKFVIENVEYGSASKRKHVHCKFDEHETIQGQEPVALVGKDGNEIAKLCCLYLFHVGRIGSSKANGVTLTIRSNRMLKKMLCWKSSDKFCLERVFCKLVS